MVLMPPSMRLQPHSRASECDPVLTAVPLRSRESAVTVSSWFDVSSENVLFTVIPPELPSQTRPDISASWKTGDLDRPGGFEHGIQLPRVLQRVDPPERSVIATSNESLINPDRGNAGPAD